MQNLKYNPNDYSQYLIQIPYRLLKQHLPQNSFFSGLFDPLDIKSKVTQIARKEINSDLNEYEIADLKEAFCLSTSCFRSFSGIQKELATISIAQMEKFLEKLTEDDDIESILKIYLDTVDDSNLMELLNFQDNGQVTDFIGIQALSKSEALRGVAQKEIKSIFYDVYTGIINFIHRIIKMLITLTGINEVLRDESSNFKSNAYIAKSQLEDLLVVLSAPTLFYQFFSAYVKPLPATTLASATLISIVVSIFAYTRYFKNCPKVPTGMYNLKEKVYNSKEPAYARLGILKQITDAFLSKKGVLLVGDSGCGKTTLVESLVSEIITGKKWEFLKNSEFYATNSTNLSAHRSLVSLIELEEKFKKHTEQVVFFFDEFASFFKKNKDGTIECQQVKTFLDSFPYVIGATTTEEYQNQIEKEKTIVGERRLRVIHLKSSDEDELEAIIQNHVHQTNPEIEFEKGVASYIAKKAHEFSPETNVMVAVKSLLKSGIAKITNPSFSKLDDEISELENQKSKRIMNFLTEEVLSNIKKIHEELQAKKSEKETKLAQLKKLEKIESVYLKVKRKSFEMANEAPNASLTTTWLKNEALKKMMGHFIKKRKEVLGLFPMLNKNLINTIIKEKKSQVAEAI